MTGARTSAQGDAAPAIAGSQIRTFAPLSRRKQNQAVSVARISERKGRERDCP